MNEVTHRNISDFVNEKGIDGCLFYWKSFSSEVKDKALKKSVSKIVTDYRAINKSKSRSDFPEKMDHF